MYSKRYRQEDERDKPANDFLRKHDKHFLAKDRTDKMSHPYLTNRQLRIRQGKEIPQSSLFDANMRKRFGIDRTPLDD